MNKADVEEIKVGMKKQWDLGWIRHESWQKDVTADFLNYFRSKNFKLSASVNDMSNDLYTIDIWWDNTRTYESYFGKNNM